jgi:hypothetical protein
MEMKTIIVQYSNKYNCEVITPVCEDAKLFARISGFSNLTKPTIDAIKRLGYVIEVVQTVRTV